ncbi:MAG TPA: amino acid permease [Pyrinomonadaceae bacterium]|nr:amino acid permease [Pyrinomonadaceae bacterium]
MAAMSLAAKPIAFAEPLPTLSVKDAVAMIVGIVVGAGIFRAPSLVAANVTSETSVLLLWVAGGAISLVGALCYAELTTTYPHTGGEYHYLTRAYGNSLSFLFAWSRITVIQTGSVALLAFVFGDYASQLLRLGHFSASIYAALLVILLTGLNMMGVQQGTRTQNLLTAVEVFSLLLVIGAGLLLIESPVAQTNPLPTPQGSNAGIGLAMVFVLLTYGGWNEATYISAEMKGRRDVARALLVGIGVITGLYLLVNWAYLRGLGLAGMGGSEAVAADLMLKATGQGGALFVSLLVAVSALTSANATVFTGARTNYALGRDFQLFRFLGRWHGAANTPTNSLIVQGAIALALVSIGTATRKGFATMVEYTAPVFWLFFFMVGLSLIVLRIRDSETPRSFRVPLYPLTPVLFCASCLYMLQASLAYTGIGALIGVAVLLTGLPVLFAARYWQSHKTKLDASSKGGE